MNAAPQVITHVKGTKTPFRMQVLRDGTPVVFGTATIRAGVQKQGSTASNSSGFKAFPVTLLQPLTAVLSASIPHTGIQWTGPTEMRAFLSGSPRVFVGAPVQVRVRSLGTNWVP